MMNFDCISRRRTCYHEAMFRLHTTTSGSGTVGPCALRAGGADERGACSRACPPAEPFGHELMAEWRPGHLALRARQRGIRASVVGCAALGVYLLFGTASVGETAVVQRLATQGPRLSGPVSISLQNEVDAAASRSRAWLLTTQHADGSWGALHPTALATLALLHAATPAEQAAARRGACWLATDAQANSAPGAAHPADALAWRDLALRTAAATLSGFAAPANATNSMPTPDVPVPPAPDAMRLASLAVAWPTLSAVTSRVGDTRAWWSLARWINVTGHGTLADAQGRVVDWRNDVAQALVASQSIDPAGHGGFWRGGSSADTLSNRVTSTAFALLAMDEL